jgi:hypothetical protein
MAMSDCVKCWDTPCTCGHDLKERSEDWLKNQLKIITAELESRTPARLGQRVELLRFGVVSEHTGLVLVPTEEAVAAVQAILGKTRYCEFGRVELPRDASATETINRMGVVKEARVCAFLDRLHYDSEEQVLWGHYYAYGPFANKANMLFEGTARLTYRCSSYTDPNAGTREIKKLITFDLIPITEELEHASPEI